MKKTLVALAVLAASGASFAQVTMTGTLAAGYAAKSTGGATTTEASGFGVDTSEVYLTATETLGGGATVTGKMGFAGLDRSGESNYVVGADNKSVTGSNGPVTGRNFTLAVKSASAGTFTLSTTYDADYLSGGIAGVGAAYSDLAKLGLLMARDRRDAITYAFPINAFTLTVSHQEGVAGSLGQYKGATGSGAEQRRNLFAGTYAAGPLAANLSYYMYDNQQDVTAPNAGNIKNMFAGSASYDLGVVKIGGGLQQFTYTGAQKITQTLFGVKAPLGAAFDVGAQWAQKKTDDAPTAAASGSQNGYLLSANYFLSKRTKVAGQYTRFDPSVGAANASTDFLLNLVHNF